MPVPPNPARWRRPLATLVTLLLAVTGAAGAAGLASAQPPEQPAAAAVAADPAAHVVTLVTGDRVQFARVPQGRYEVTVDPAPRPGGSGVTFQTVDDGEQLYVFPSDALDLLPDPLDRELFNVTKLARYGYTDGVPVIATSRGARTTATAGMTGTTTLASIGAVAGTVEPGGTWWRSVTGTPAPGARSAAGTGRVWLDEQVRATLADSVPQVGAPQAWDAGFDGTGVTVAVLDTGIDAGHPDLAGIQAAENFSDSDTVTDRHGHGTHVAGIIAGSGAGSDGAYTGVAPGATLLNGKVIGDDGFGSTSDIIAGMEWAAGQGADVINMSLGGPGTDGTDPLSLAVNRITDQHGVLFAISAGNNGPSEQTLGSPGVASAALTVGAVDDADQLARFSSRGPRRGDFAIKPDLTAPGVGIVSARAAGTALGPVVGDHYTQISGTSMAAPHAAGAAAILRQAEPDLDPGEVKARLVGSAQPHPGLDVYQQGGGRLDIPGALAAPVHTSPATLDLGYLPYPHEDAQPVATSITYTNLGGAPVLLDLELDVRSRDGAVPGPDMLSVAPATLTVPAGGTATATVTLDGSVGELGRYGGYLVADAGPDGAVRTPVGFYKEPESYQLTITGIARDGRPAGGISNVSVLNVDNMAQFFRPVVGFAGGQATLRVPPGTYSVVGAIHTYDAHHADIQQTAFVGDPELAVLQDTTLELDAREANPITIDVPEPQARPQGQVGLGYFRTAATPGPLLGMAFIGLHPGAEYFAQPTDPVGTGEFELYTRWRMAAPEAELDVTAPVALPLDPVLVRPPAVDGDRRVPLVDAGTGAAGEYAGRDVTGAAVLTRRGPVPLAEQEQSAAAAGAAALVVSNDVPGKLVGRLGEAGTIPTLSVTEAEGEQLRALLAAGGVTVRLRGTAWSPYLYDLLLLEQAVPEEPRYDVTGADLARLDVDYHGQVPGHPMGEARHFARPFHSSAVFLHPPVTGARERTEYLLGDPGVRYRQTVYGEQPFEAQLREQAYRAYPAGERFETSWFRQVLRPALLPDVDRTVRTGDTLDLAVYEWVDAAGNHFPDLFGLAPYPGDTIETRLYRDGEQVATTGVPRGTFPLAADPARYRIELDVDRQADWWRGSAATRTAWTFDSARPAGGGTEPLPLLSVDYQAAVDLWNAALHPRDRRGPPFLGFQVRQQVPGEQPAVAGARLWVSYDDGDTWRSRSVFDRGDGQFESVLANRSPVTGTGYLSLRVEAWDAAGNRIEQEVIRAWRLPDR